MTFSFPVTHVRTNSTSEAVITDCEGQSMD
jgi:hypothetical protein